MKIVDRFVWLVALTLACGGGDDDASTASGSLSQGPTSTTAGTEASDTGTSAGESTTAEETSTTEAPTSGLPSDSSDGGSACDPVVPGEWNRCLTSGGTVDNSQCNWMGTGSATGFIGCLTSSRTEGANVCMISGCRDVCDCFAPPSSGTAEVVCDAILANGGTACALSCSAGQTCPDGMSCEGGLCFWLAE
jgi:hypothetical protein